MTGTPLKIILICATLLYYTALVLSLIRKKEKIALLSRILYGIALAMNFGVVVNNFILNGYIPFVSMFQVLSFIAMLFGPIMIFMIYVRKDAWMRPFFITASAILATGLCFMNADAATELRPALRSPFFYPHVLCYTVSYTLAVIAFLIALTRFFTKDQEKKAQMNKGIYDTVCFVFLFATLGMFVGAIWANEVWGAFWSFDNKENWALVTWLMYAVYLHFRKNKALAKFSDVPVILGFVCVVITMFFSGSGVHSYL